ncbi:FHA domain-containing protein [Cystobacter fuscus]|uniref:FHA domain-containing protein n=1 Tax=Cystobacter fuscus TaxID=43 RepID=UPI002B2A7A46|nr:hypothetical protein F0U63_33910 [Cystobacter fuscus]
MPLLGRHVPLEKPVVSVGADSACGVVLREPGVKPSHALLIQDARGWTVSATARGCEVRVRNKRVELGRVTLTLLSSEAAPAVAGSSPEVASDAALVGAPSVVALRPTYALVLPLRGGTAPLSVVYLGRHTGRPPFSPRELEEAMALTSLAAPFRVL